MRKPSHTQLRILRLMVNFDKLIFQERDYPFDWFVSTAPKTHIHKSTVYSMSAAGLIEADDWDLSYSVTGVGKEVNSKYPEK